MARRSDDPDAVRAKSRYDLGALGVTLPSHNFSSRFCVMVTRLCHRCFFCGSQARDVTVSSLEIESLRGGTLLLTPLKGADGQFMRCRKGNVLVGGSAPLGRVEVTVNHLSVGRITACARSRRVPTTLGAMGMSIFR